MLQTRNSVVARLVLGTNVERPKLFISTKAIDAWCVKNSITPLQFKRDLNALGLIVAVGDNLDKKVSLGRGVPSHPMGQCRCLEFKFSAAQGYIDEFVGSGNVVAIQSAKKVTPDVEEEKPVIAL